MSPDNVTLGLAFLAGLASFLPPCVLALVPAYVVEYSSMKFGAFFMTDFIETILIAALIATLFFGGWQVPYLQSYGFQFPWGGSLSLGPWTVTTLQVASFGLKVFVICWFLLLIRWTLPRFRYDQLMHLGWKIMLPISVLNIFVTGAILLLFRK